MTENWKDIPDYEGHYQVSDKGRLRSLDITSALGKQLKGKIRKLTKGKRGYLRVNLSKEGVKKTYTIHKLVMLAFVGPRPEGLVIDHIDEIKHNNNLSNLRYISNRENCSRNTKGGSSKYTGVSWCYSRNNWRARISIEDKAVYLGSFKTEIEAAEAYQQALKNLR